MIKKKIMLLLKINFAFKRRLRKLFYYLILNKVGSSCEFGKNIIIQGYNSITLGKNVHINDQVILQANKSQLIIKDNVNISFGAKLITAALPLDNNGPSRKKHIYDKIIINQNSWVGAGAIILPGIIIGENSVIGAGAVVTKNVPPFSLVAGVPAKIVKNFKKNEKDKKNF